jgi:hypothetical protein
MNVLYGAGRRAALIKLIVWTDQARHRCCNRSWRARPPPVRRRSLSICWGFKRNVITWFILSGGAFLCFLSLVVLRILAQTRRQYVRTLEEAGIPVAPMLFADVMLFVAWFAVFLIGCALLAWGWIR